jgi:hypothetical protein
MDGRLTGLMDNRLDVYRRNSRRIPSVAGRIIPERAFTRADYERLILQPMYADIAPHDPAGVLQEEFLNARGAIARFSRGSIEIRLLDVQECPQADLAIAAAVVGVLKSLVAETWSDLASQQRVEIEPLERVLLATIRDAERAIVDEPAVLEQFGFNARPQMRAGQVWAHLVRNLRGDSDRKVATQLQLPGLGVPLASRIRGRLGAVPTTEMLRQTYRELAECVGRGSAFEA